MSAASVELIHIDAMLGWPDCCKLLEAAVGTSCCTPGACCSLLAPQLEALMLNRSAKSAKARPHSRTGLAFWPGRKPQGPIAEDCRTKKKQN